MSTKALVNTITTRGGYELSVYSDSGGVTLGSYISRSQFDGESALVDLDDDEVAWLVDALRASGKKDSVGREPVENFPR